jgi:hypothetical protein
MKTVLLQGREEFESLSINDLMTALERLPHNT